MLIPRFRTWEGLASRLRVASSFDGYVGAGAGVVRAMLAQPRLRASEILRAKDPDGRLGLLTNAAKWSRRQWEDFWGSPALAQIVPQVGGGQLISVMPALGPIPDFSQFANEIKGVQEIVRWTLYSYKAYATGGQATLLFFDQTEGAATNGSRDTNMVNGGMLPNNQMQVVTAIGVEPEPAQADVFVANATTKAGNEWYLAMNSGTLEVSISNKQYVYASPLWRFPAGFGPGTFHTAGAAAATTLNGSYLNNGSPDNKAKYNVDPPLGILPGRPFNGRIRWDASRAVTTAGRIGLGYDGWMVRAVS